MLNILTNSVKQSNELIMWKTKSESESILNQTFDCMVLSEILGENRVVAAIHNDIQLSKI